MSLSKITISGLGIYQRQTTHPEVFVLKLCVGTIQPVDAGTGTPFSDLSSILSWTNQGRAGSENCCLLPEGWLDLEQGTCPRALSQTTVVMENCRRSAPQPAWGCNTGVARPTHQPRENWGFLWAGVNAHLTLGNWKAACAQESPKYLLIPNKAKA